MIGITRGVVVVLLLAGAVAGAAAFPRLFAGPGNGQTPSFALVPAAAQPAIVQAPALPLPRVRLSPPAERVVVAAAVHRPTPAPARVHVAPKAIVIRRIVPPAPVTPASETPAPVTPAPVPSPSKTPIPAAAPAPPPARSIAAASAPAVVPATPAPP